MSVYISAEMVLQGNPRIACKRLAGSVQMVRDASGTAQIELAADGVIDEQITVQGTYQRCPDKDNGVGE